MPTGNLPPEGKKLWEEVYQKAKSGSCKDSDDVEKCAAGSAWKAVKNAGWKKQGDNWVKGKALTEFSLTIKKAYYDTNTNEMRWRADTSDTEIDAFGDKMSIELYNDFLERAQTNQSPPEEFVSEFWQGGLPYLSISHYPDLNGEGVPGSVENVYVDGKFLKAKGTFFDTTLGKRAWEAVKKGLESDEEDKVRISIAFVDYKHKHLSTGYEFTRTDEDPICAECLKEFFTGEYGGKEYQRGHLIHLALTKVPVNERTLMEVDRSMTTRKEDAGSIVGDDLAEELENKAVGEISKSLVVKSEGEDEEVPVQDYEGRFTAIEQSLAEIAKSLVELKKEPPKEEMDEEEDDENEKKKEKKMEAKSEAVQLAEILAPALETIAGKLDILITASSQGKVEQPYVPQRRSYTPPIVNAPPDERPRNPYAPVSITELARRSVIGQ